MEDPKYNASIKVGSKESSYSFLAFPRGVTGGLQASQSFILQLTFTDEQSPGQPFDISGATATLYCSGYNVTDYPETILGAGVLSDSGSGTTDTVTFTVTKDQIPDDLGNLPTSKTGNSVFYCILEDADTKLQFYQSLNVLDEKFQLTGTNSVSDNIILAGGNDLGTVINTQLTTPPVSPVLNDSYIVGVGSTGDWSGQDKKLAVWNGAAWIYRDPEVGNFVYDTAAEATYTYTSSLIWDVVVVADGSITEAKLATSSVTNTKLATDSVSQDKMQDNSVGTAEILDSNVTEAKLATSSVTNTKLATDSVSQDKMQDNSVGTNEVIDSNITEAKLATGAVTNTKLGADAVTQDKIAAGAVGSTELGTVSINDLSDVDLTGNSNGYILKYNGGSGNFEPAAESGGGTGIINIPYVFDNTTTIGGIAAGQIRYNNATPASVTEIYVHAFDNDGLDIGTLINTLNGGNVLKVKQDSTKTGVFTVTTATDNLDNTYTLSVTAGTQASLPDNLGNVSLGLFYVVSGSSGLVSFNGRTTPAAIPAAGDYDTDQVDNVSTVTGTTLSDALNNLANMSGGFPAGRVTGLATTGTVDIDWSTHKYFIIGTMTGGINITFSNVSQGQTIYIDVTGASGYEFELPASVTTTLEGTSFTPNVRNIIRIDAVNGATAQEAVFNLDTESTSTFDASKNLIIDGQLNHWDEGAGPFTSNGYTATMFFTSLNGTTGGEVERKSFTIGQTDVMDAPKYYADISFSSIDQATGFTSFLQRVKGVELLAGKTVTFSFDAKGSVAGSIGVFWDQIFGTGGTPSAAVAQGLAELIPITTSWASYSVTFTLPSVVGKTLGTDNNDSTFIRIVSYAGTDNTFFLGTNPTYSGTLSIANVALAEGDAPFAGPWPTAEEERQRILPYFEVIGDYEEGVEGGSVTIPLFAITDTGSSQARRALIQYDKKIKTPSITLGTTSSMNTLTAGSITRTSLKLAGQSVASSSEGTVSHIIIDARL